MAYAAFALPGHMDGSPSNHSLTSRSAQLICALAVPVAALVAAWMCDAAVRLPRRRERVPALHWPVLALAVAGLAFAAWAVLHFG